MYDIEKYGFFQKFKWMRFDRRFKKDNGVGAKFFTFFDLLQEFTRM